MLDDIKLPKLENLYMGNLRYILDDNSIGNEGLYFILNKYDTQLKKLWISK